jgi:hypothetical protein
MSEEKDPILDNHENDGLSEIEVVRQSLGFEGFKLSESPMWDMRRKIVLGKILPLVFIGKTYDEIHEELHIARSQIYEIMKLYYAAVQQDELVDMHWWQLFFYCKKNKPEVAFNALTQIKLKKMALAQPTQVGEIVLKWGKDEQNTGNNDKLSSTVGPEVSSRELVPIQNVALRKTLGQDDLGSK